MGRALSTRATAFGRRILLSNAEGVITATAPTGGPIGLRLIDVLGETQPLTILGASAGVLEITLADGTQAFATVRTLAAARGQLSVFQLRSDALAPWRSDTTLTVTTESDKPGRHLVAKDKQGTVLFDGDLDAPGAQDSLPAVVKEKLKKMEDTGVEPPKPERAG